VLCEKPVITDPDKLKRVEFFCNQGNINLYVVNQYAHLEEYGAFKDKEAGTSYDFYNSGRDSLKWDCFQLFGLANGAIELRFDSWSWVCYINGIRINISNMDKAYMSMVEDFLGPKNRMWGMEKIKEITRKVSMYE
jgi:hypothetical protein